MRSFAAALALSFALLIPATSFARPVVDHARQSHFDPATTQSSHLASPADLAPQVSTVSSDDGTSPVVYVLAGVGILVMAGGLAYGVVRVSQTRTSRRRPAGQF